MVGDTDFVDNQSWVSIICPNTAELKRAGEQDRINGELVLTWEKNILVLYKRVFKDGIIPMVS